MQSKAKLKYLRIAPRKVRLVADLVRNKNVEEAQTILRFTVKKAAGPILKLLNSAIANARNNLRADPSNLYISRIAVDEGPKYKRWMPRARGQASEIQKKTSHITIILDEIEKKPQKVKRIKKAEEAPKLKKLPEKISKAEKPSEERAKFKPEIKKPPKQAKPKIVRGIKKIFQRKAF